MIVEAKRSVDFREKWRAECLNSKFPLPILLHAGYRVKMKKNVNIKHSNYNIVLSELRTRAPYENLIQTIKATIKISKYTILSPLKYKTVFPKKKNKMILYKKNLSSTG